MPLPLGATKVLFLPGATPPPPLFPRGIRVVFSRPLACNVGLHGASVQIPRQFLGLADDGGDLLEPEGSCFEDYTGATLWLFLVSSHTALGHCVGPVELGGFSAFFFCLCSGQSDGLLEALQG